MRFLVALGAAVLLASSSTASAQCPASPNLNVRYSDHFYQAQKTFVARSHEAAVGLSIALPDFPVPIGASSIDKSALSTLSTVTTDKAYTYVQEELRDHGTAIVAECMAALCRLSNPSNVGASAIIRSSLEMQSITSICREALHIQSGWSSEQVIALPSPVVVIFKNNSSTKLVQVHVANLTAGTMEMRVDQAPGLTANQKAALPIAFEGQDRDLKFTLKNREIRALPFVVARPEKDAGIQHFTLDVLVQADNSVAAHAQFLVMREEDLIPKPVIGCGLENPKAHIKTDSDHGQTHEETHDRDTALESGVELKGGPTWDWINNGGAAAKAEYRFLCVRNEANDRLARTELEISSTAGGKCGRNGTNKGGGGHISPQWRTELWLPGIPSTRWNVEIQARSRRVAYKGGCRLYMGKEELELPIDKTQRTLTKSLPQGLYTVQLDCFGEDAGCVGGSEYTWNTGNDDIFVSISASRK